MCETLPSTGQSWGWRRCPKGATGLGTIHKVPRKPRWHPDAAAEFLKPWDTSTGQPQPHQQGAASLPVPTSPEAWERGWDISCCHGSCREPTVCPQSGPTGLRHREPFPSAVSRSHRLPAHTSALPLHLCLSAPPADFRDNPRCFLCHCLPPQPFSRWWGSTLLPSLPWEGQSRTLSLLPSNTASRTPRGFRGAWGGGGLSPSSSSSSPLHPPLSLLSVCLPGLPAPCPHPCPRPPGRASLSHSLVLCRWT